MKTTKIVILLVLGMLVFRSYGQPLLTLTDTTSVLPIAHQAEFFEDTSTTLTIENISKTDRRIDWQSIGTHFRSFGITESAFWIRFQLSNESEQTQWIFEHQWPNVHHVQLYWSDGVSEGFSALQGGHFLEGGGDAIKHRRVLFDLNIPTQTTRTYYLRIKSNASIKAIYNLYHPNHFYKKDRSDFFRLGLFFGTLAILAFGNVLLFSYFREPSQLWLAGFIGFSALVYGTFEGLMTLIFPQIGYLINTYLFVPSLCLAVIALLQYSRDIVTKKHSQTFAKFSRALQLGLIILAMLSFVNYSLALKLFIVLFFLTLMALTYGGVKLVIKGFYLARYYSLGIFTFFIAGIVHIALSFTSFKFHAFAADILRFALVLMCFFFSFAFVDAVKWVKKTSTKMNEALADSEQRFKAIFDQSFQMTTLISPKGVILDVNQPAQDFDGLSKDDIVGKYLWDIGDIKQHEATRNRIQQEMSRAGKGEQRRFEMAFRGLDGAKHWLDISLKPYLNTKGGMEFVIGEARDITENKHIELMLGEIAKGVSASSGTQFLNTMVHQLAKLFDAECVWIGRFVPHDHEVEVISSTSDTFDASPRYSLYNSPCEKLIEQSVFKVPFCCSQHFPSFVLSKKQTFESYVAAAIKDDSEQNIGLIAVTTQRAIVNEEKVSEILQIFTSRVAAELSRIEVNQSLITTKERLSAHLENTPLAVIELDQNLVVTEWNNAAFHVYGYDRNEAIGKSIQQLIFPAEGHMDLDELQLMFYSSSENRYTRLMNMTKDGTPLVCDWYKTQLHDEHGQLMGVAALIADVSIEQRALLELKKRDKDQQEILNSLTDGVITIDGEGEMLNVNRATLSLFNYAESELLGENVTMLMPKEMVEPHKRSMKRYYETGESNIIGIGRDLHGKKKDQSLFPVRVSIAEISEPEQGDIRFVIFLHDLTLVQQQEEQIRRSQKMDALGKLTGGIAHDFNNLIGIILGYAEFLSFEAEPGSELANYAAEIMKAGERGASLTKRLLSFSKAQSAASATLNINEVINDEKEMLEKTITPRIRLELDLEPELWLTNLDPSDLEDALLNMSINASHAIEGTGEIVFQTRNETFDTFYAMAMNIEAGDYVMLSVSDTGKGMESDTIERIFEPFYSTKGELGTGLGLSQVYGFVERSNGAIKVYSKVGRGTSFKMFFPRCTEATHSTRCIVEEDIDNKSLYGEGAILVVDDEVALLQVVKASLEQHGYEVYTAERGETALKILDQHPIDLVVSDVIMPEMDGYELASKIRASYPNIKLQLASGFTDDRQQSHEDEQLTKSLLKKPYQMKHLLVRVKELLKS